MQQEKFFCCSSLRSLKTQGYPDQTHVCIKQQRFLIKKFILDYWIIFLPEFLDLLVLVVLSNSSSLSFTRRKVEAVKSSLNCVVFYLLPQMSRVFSKTKKNPPSFGLDQIRFHFLFKELSMCQDTQGIKSWQVGCSLNMRFVSISSPSSPHYYLSRCCSYFPLHVCFQFGQREGKQTHKPNLEWEFYLR